MIIYGHCIHLYTNSISNKFPGVASPYTSRSCDIKKNI